MPPATRKRKAPPAETPANQDNTPPQSTTKRLHKSVGSTTSSSSLNLPPRAKRNSYQEIIAGIREDVNRYLAFAAQEKKTKKRKTASTKKPTLSKSEADTESDGYSDDMDLNTRLKRAREDRERLAKEREEREKERELQEAEDSFVPTELPLSLQSYVDRDRCPLLVKSGHYYWPAYLTGFQPVQTYREREIEGKKDVYEIIAHPAPNIRANAEGKSLKLKKDLIFLDDDEVAKCLMGYVRSEDRITPSDARTRAPTPPIPGLDPEGPMDPQPFLELGAKDQLLYLRPHLSRILNESYPPAQWRIEAFFNPSKREGLRKWKDLGNIREIQAAHVLIPELERWAMRSLRWTYRLVPSEIQDQVEVNPPSGSPRFDALPPKIRADYVDLVIIPEAVIALRRRTETVAKMAQEALSKRRKEAEHRADLLELMGPKYLAKSKKGKGQAIETRSDRPRLVSEISDERLALFIGSNGSNDDTKSIASEDPATATATDTATLIAPAATDPIHPEEWELYALVRAYLETLQQDDEATIWQLIITTIQNKRKMARERLGLHDETETKAEKLARTQREKGKKAIWKNGRITEKVDYEE